MNQAFIVAAQRTPIGKYRGALSHCRPDDLAALVINAVIAKAGIDGADVEEVIFGATNQAGEDNRDVARMAALLAGLPYEVTGVTVNRLCGSGMEAVVQAFRGISVGAFDVAVAGGVESMTRAPFVMGRAEEPFPRNAPTVYDSRLGWRFTNPKMQERFALISMGETAEKVAEQYGVSREAQDHFALRSHQQAAAAIAEGWFDDEIIPVDITPKKHSGEPVLFSQDEGVRSDTTLQKLESLTPAFRADGSVTAGNASPLSDGAAALLIVSESFMKKRKLTPLARVVDSAVAGVHPEIMGIGPVPATQKLLQRTQTNVERIATMELNEAFASQSLACIAELNIDPQKVNPHGGAIALGHPIGCSGARVVVTLAHSMTKKSVSTGIAACCIGVGQGISLMLSR